ncbi:MAG: pilus assembly protein CpaF [Saprospiraceae bacterium]|jgi:pilus assembly protein CpaF
MFDVLITDKRGETSKVRCVTNKCTLGKSRDNLVQLKGWSLGGVHAEITQTEGGIFVEDFDTRIGTAVNDEFIDEKYGPLRSGDIIEIDTYEIRVGWIEEEKSEDDNPAQVNVTEMETVKKIKVPPRKISNDEGGEEAPAHSAADLMRTMIGVRPNIESKNDEAVFRETRFVWRNKIHQELVKVMDLRRTDVGSMDEDELRSHIKEMIEEILDQLDGSLPEQLTREQLSKEVLDEAVGLGPLEELLANDTVTEIMVNRFDQIYIERAGRLTSSDVAFSSDHAVMAAIERIVSPLGRRIDESSPMVDARLKDGSRVNAIIPPLAINGPCLTIRKFSKKKLTDVDMVGFGSINEDMVSLLKVAVKQKKNIIISGGTGSGKTTLLNILSNFIPSDERIVTVEDAAELQLNQPHVVSLEARPANMEGKGAITIRELVKNCLRMRPDRIVVGECRGGEALDMLQAMNTGHDGSLTTVHANSSRDVVSRLEVMVMMSGLDLPIQSIREQVASSVDLIVQQSRMGDGSRKVTQITEITGVEGGIVQMADIFKYNQRGFDENGKVIGSFSATGAIPEFYEDLKERGLPVDLSIFQVG